MKRLFYLVVLLYVFYKTVYCEVQDGLSIEKDSNTRSWAQGTRHEIICRASNRNQQLTWESPSLSTIEYRDAQDTQRVYIQDRTRKGSLPTLAVVIKHVLIEDSGVWQCLSGDIVETVVICVIDEARFVDSPPETVDRGRAITLTCSVFGNPEPYINWYKDNVPITDDETVSKYRITTKYNTDGREGLLTILNTDIDDAALYTCEAVQIQENNHLCYHNESFNINLYVNYEPTMQIESPTEFPINTIYTDHGELVHLKCIADGYPEPEYKWIQKQAFYSDIAINSSLVSMKDGVSYLHIKADDAMFKKEIACIATNPYGKASKTFKLLPKMVPEVPIQVYTAESNDTSISFSLAWGHPLETIITEVVAMYIETSELPEGIIRKESDWKGSNKQYIKWEEQPNDEEHFVTVDQLKPKTEYWLRFSVRNDYGLSRWTKPIGATTAESNEEEDPKEFHKVDVRTDNNSEYFSDNMFYAIIFLGGMGGIIFVCSIIIKLM